MSVNGIDMQESESIEHENEYSFTCDETSIDSEECKPQKFSLIIKMLLCALFWGGTFIAGKIAATYASPPFLGLLRFFFASLLLIAYLLFTNNIKAMFVLTKKQFIGVTILALSGIWAYNLFFFYGLQTVPAARASLIVANNPLLIALGAALFLKEKLTPLKFLGILTSICGASIIISNGDIMAVLSSFTQGDIAILFCVVTWAIYSLVGKVVLKSLTPLIAVTWACIIGTLLFIPFALNEETMQNLPSFPLELWLCALYLGLFGSALGFVFFYQAVKGLGATKSGVFINFVPVFGVVLSAIFLNEDISPAMIFGGMFTILGVYLTNKKTKKKA